MDGEDKDFRLLKSRIDSLRKTLYTYKPTPQDGQVISSLVVSLRFIRHKKEREKKWYVCALQFVRNENSNFLFQLSRWSSKSIDQHSKKNTSRYCVLLFKSKLVGNWRMKKKSLKCFF